MFLRATVLLSLLGWAWFDAACAAPLHFDAPKRWLTLGYATPGSGLLWPMFGRVNADAKVDLVLYDYARGDAYLAPSSGTSFGALKLYSSGLPRFSEPTFLALLADVNGDGLADLVIMNHGADDVSGAATAVVALNTGKGFSYPAEKVWNASWCASYQSCLAADINGDHREDLVGFTPNFGTVWGTLSTGAAFGPNAVFNSHFCITGENCFLGDVNGDGKADAILFKPNAPGNQKGNVLWARATGSAFVDPKYGHGYFCIGGEKCLVGDVNGDGRADIVLVKGFGSGQPGLEVLVSLSNGSQFINAVPFTWAMPPYFDPGNKTFGSFVLADVSGDGKADLVEWGSQSAPRPEGGYRNNGMAFDTFVATDQFTVPLPGHAPAPANEVGWSAINFYNCQTDQQRLIYWNVDNMTGGRNQSSLTDAMYDESGRCPDLNDPPVNMKLVSGHVHTFVAVDPEALGCDGRNDPGVAGCAYGSLVLRGAANGPVCNWIVGAQTPSCVSTLHTRSFPGREAIADRCLPSYVRREARPSDHVCVSPQSHELAVTENLLAASRHAAQGGVSGPMTCLGGYVWRDAFPGDHVCVPPPARDRVREENRLGPQRQAPA